MGNYHVQFLGGNRAAMPVTYPVPLKIQRAFGDVLHAYNARRDTRVSPTSSLAPNGRA